MSTPPRPAGPGGADGSGLTPELVDELLSALIDGELDAAAADLGLDPVETRAALDAVPGVRARRRALEAARDALASPPLDEVSRHRLLSAALGRTPRRRQATPGRWSAVLAGSAAALLLLVVGVLAVLGDGGGNDDATNAAGGGDADRAPALLEGEVPDLGEVSDPEVLREKVQALGADELRAPKAEEGADGGAYAPSTAAALDATPTTVAPEAGAVTEDEAGAGSASDCAAGIATDFASGDAARIRATGTFQGRGAGIAVFDVGDRLLVVVYALDDCSVLASQSLR